MLICVAAGVFRSFANGFEHCNKAQRVRNHRKSWTWCSSFPSQIVSQLPTQNPEAPIMLDRMLRMLASYSLFTSSLVDDPTIHGSVHRVYGLGPISKYFVKNENGASLGPLLDLLQDKVLTDIW